MAMKENFVDYTIDEFCKKMNIGPSALASVCGVNRQYIYDLKNIRKHHYVVRHNESSNDIRIIKTEKTMCHGNLKKER